MSRTCSDVQWCVTKYLYQLMSLDQANNYLGKNLQDFDFLKSD